MLLSSLLGIVGGAGDPVAADPLAEKRAEAERVARELAAQGQRVSVAAEQLNQARLRAARLADEVRAAEGELAAAEQEVGLARARVRDRAVATYVRGQLLPMEQLLVSGSAADLAVRQAYVTTIVGHERAAIDALDEAQERRRTQRVQLGEAQRSAQAVLEEAAGRQKEAAEAAEARRQTLARVQGELKDLVAAEEARRAAEEARRVQAELAARQAREEAARLAAAERAREEAARAAEEAARRARDVAGSVRAPVPTTAPTRDTDAGADAPAPAAGAASAVAEARRQLGKPYEWGAAGPDSFDCSGLTMWAWRAGGRSLPHGSQAQYGATRRVGVTEVQPGDLLFYGSPIHHVGIYAGDGQMVESSETGTPVRMASIYRRDLVGVGRVG